MREADQILFLKIAKTFMKKALNRLPQKVANLNDVIELADGDIRSAINTIAFNGAKATKGNSCAAVDSQLLLFRALGRILNSKRELTKESVVPSTLPTSLQRNELSYVPEEQWALSGFLATTFSSFLHQNMTPFLPDIATHNHIAGDLSLSDLFSAKYGHMERLSDYQAVVSSRSLAFWNHCPNKVGFIALHRPKSIENRATQLTNQAKISAAKFNAWHGASTCSLVTNLVPAFVAIAPRHHLTIQFGDVARFPRFTSHNGARLDEKDELKKTEDEDEQPLQLKIEQEKTPEDFENGLHISDDDSDW